MKTKILLAIMLVLAQSVSARIGETIEQADVRYGIPISIKAEGYGGFPERTYRKGDIEIVAHFMDGKIACIEFSKIEDDAQFEASEFKTLVRAQGIHVSDEKLFTPKDRFWTAFSGEGPATITAVFDHEMKRIHVVTSEYSTRASVLEATRKRKAAEEKLKGF